MPIKESSPQCIFATISAVPLDIVVLKTSTINDDVFSGKRGRTGCIEVWRF
jgi:hypothetical protein